MKHALPLLVLGLCAGVLPAGLAAMGPSRPGVQEENRAAVRFTEVARASGVDFHHFDPVTDKQFISETIGSGAGWIDFDGDGWQDLMLINSTPMPGSGPAPDSSPRSRVFRNRGGTRFDDVTDRVWNCPTGFGQGCAVGDFDNDGFDDVYVSYYLGANRLFHNQGDGTFQEIAAGTDCPLWSTSCAWADLDGDGDLDLYVCNYLDMPLDDYPFCGDKRRNIRTVCSPVKFPGQSDVVYANRGDGTFEDVSEAWGFRPEESRSLGVVVADLDDDGLPDVFVANDMSPNLLYCNRGGGRFEEVGLASGSAVSADGKAQAGMGIDAADIDGDGRPDLFVTNFFREPNSLFHNRGKLQFNEISARSGLGRPSYWKLGFGCGFFDADNDGHLDVFVANGHIDRNPEAHGFPEPYRQPAQLFIGNGQARFTERTGSDAGAYFQERHVGRAAAFGDFNNDGRTDIAVNHNGEPAALLRNDSTGGHWLRIVLTGTASNRSAIGAQLKITCGGRTSTHQVVGGRSYLSAHDLRPLIGIGTAEAADHIEIRWPSGRSRSLLDLAADQVTLIRE
jgi:hypothetical protein